MSISRRDFMSLVGGSVAGATAVAVSSKLVTNAPAASVSAVQQDWRIAEIGQPSTGAQPLLLVNHSNGEELHIELCRRGSRQQPVASSRHFDVFLANGGNGAVRTSREHVVVARNLAGKLDRHFAQVPRGVLSMDERQARHRELYETSDDIISA